MTAAEPSLRPDNNSVALSDAIFPLIAANDDEGGRAIALRSMRVMSSLMTLLMVCGITVLKPFL